MNRSRTLTHIMANDTMLLLKEKCGRRSLQGADGDVASLSVQRRRSAHRHPRQDGFAGLWAAGGACSNCWTNGGGGQAGLGVQSAAITGFVAGEDAGAYAAGNPRREIDEAYAEQVIARVVAPMERPAGRRRRRHI